MSVESLHIEEEMTVSKLEIGALMRSLEWQVDDAITNPDGEQVWLRAAHHPVTGERTGITDCCPVSAPCAHHAKLAKSRRAIS